MSSEGKGVLGVIESLQWAFNFRRCPVCAGWNCGPNGETDFHHTDSCTVPKAFAVISELIAADVEYDAALNDPADETIPWQEKHETAWPRFYAAKSRRAAALKAAQGGE